MNHGQDNFADLNSAKQGSDKFATLTPLKQGCHELVGMTYLKISSDGIKRMSKRFFGAQSVFPILQLCREYHFNRNFIILVVLVIYPS